MIEKGYYKRKSCRTCLSENLHRVVNLTPTPPGNNFIEESNLEISEQVFPLDLYFCKECFHTQLGHVVDERFLFQNDYSYVSSTSPVFVKHLSDYAKYAIEILGLNNSSFVIDIGSNDGTCLNFFKEEGIKVLGIDPAEKITEIAKSKGIETITDFFSFSLAESIITDYGYADLITSHNACAHIDDLDGVIKGVSHLLKQDGAFIMEVGYFLDVFQNKWFDTIYHEHLDFHTVKPLEKLFSRFDMEIFKIERISPQGGSIRVFAQKNNGINKVDSSIDDLKSLEKSSGLYDLKTYLQFEKDINYVKSSFQKLINEIKERGESIAAFGAPTKATTLCYHFEIDKNQIDFIVDDNPLKQGLYSPGKHIPVYDSSFIYKEKPDYLVILAWNFAESIMQKHQDYLKSGGKFILPMPQPKVLKRI